MNSNEQIYLNKYYSKNNNQPYNGNNIYSINTITMEATRWVEDVPPTTQQQATT